MAIKPSPGFAVLLLFIHVVVATVVCLTNMPLPARLALILLITLSLFYYVARDVLLLLPNSWCEVTLSQEGQSVVTRDGSRYPFSIANKTFVCPRFVVLRVSLERYYLRSSRVIFPDALASGVFRELCVRLKFG